MSKTDFVCECILKPKSLTKEQKIDTFNLSIESYNERLKFSPKECHSSILYSIEKLEKYIKTVQGRKL